MTTDWTPDQPLRADATDEQITRRVQWARSLTASEYEVITGKLGNYVPGLTPFLARELLAATVAEYEAKLAALEFERDDLERVNAEFFDRIEVKREQIAALEAKYTELLYAVAQKFVGESRHETALRYIREREIAATQSSPNAARTPSTEPTNDR